MRKVEIQAPPIKRLKSSLLAMKAERLKQSTPNFTAQITALPRISVQNYHSETRSEDNDILNYRFGGVD